MVVNCVTIEEVVGEESFVVEVPADGGTGCVLVETMRSLLVWWCVCVAVG